MKSGETIATIANKYKIKRADLADANGLKTSTKLRAGQSLLVPGAAAAVVTSARTAPAAPSGDAKTTAKTPTATAKAPAAASGTPLMYKIKKGDTLFGIARQFDVTIDELKKWNNLATSALSVGKQIKIYRH